MICAQCRRMVRRAHPECGGDPRATCIVYGCGLEGHGPWVAVEDDYRPTVHVRYCKEHLSVNYEASKLQARSRVLALLTDRATTLSAACW